MSKMGRGLLLPLLCIQLTGCDLEELRRLQQPRPEEPIACILPHVFTARSIWFFKLGDITDRRVEFFSNETLVWTSEKPEADRGWVSYQNGVLRFMSSDDFGEIRLEEKDQNGASIRAPINLKLLNGEQPAFSDGCGGPTLRPPQIYFDFTKLTN